LAGVRHRSKPAVLPRARSLCLFLSVSLSLGSACDPPPRRPCAQPPPPPCVYRCGLERGGRRRLRGRPSTSSALPAARTPTARTSTLPHAAVAFNKNTEAPQAF
jgi:hypothetical protein